MNLAVYVGADKGKASVTAHTCRAFKGEILCLTVSEVKEDTFGAEHTLRLLLPCSNSRIAVASVKDTLEINVEDNVGKIIKDGVQGRVIVLITLDGAHGLEEDRVVLLVGLALPYNGTLCLSLVQMVMIAVGFSIISFGVGDQCLRGYGMYFITNVGHCFASCSWFFLSLYHNFVNFSIGAVK